MLALGIIEHVTEPTDWCTRMVPEEIKTQDKGRVCINLKCLNEVVKHERYMLPTLEETTPKVTGGKGEEWS